jgi:hypothetical protein
VIQWENGWGGSGGSERILGGVCLESVKNQKKSVQIRPIRPIRSPIVSQPFLSCTKKYSLKIVFDFTWSEKYLL